MRALLIGGAGSTGRHLIDGLLDRGCRLTVLNRGSRPDAGAPPDVERIKADPHFAETLAPALSGRRFDLVIATYGRLKAVADVVSGITGRLITVGGMPVYRGFATPRALTPTGMPIPTRETHPTVESDQEHAFSHKISRTEQYVMSLGGPGLAVTHYRYPLIYGRNPITANKIWWFVQRCLDGRRAVALPEAGLSVFSRGFAVNMAHAVMLAVDRPDAAAGRIYNCADDRQFSLAQWGEIIFDELGGAMEVVSVPDAYASHARDLQLFRDESFHRLLCTTRIRDELGYRDIVEPEAGLRETVRALRETPPDDTVIEALRAQYPLEDALIRIQSEANERLAALDHDTSAYRHSYAHPRKPNEARDHMGR